MTQTEEHDPITQKVVDALESQADATDKATLDALNQARRKAMTRIRKPSRARPVYWLPATGLVSAVVVAMLWFQQPHAPHPQSLDDFELLTSEEDLEMLEDMEFVAWLMLEEDQNAG